MAEFMKDFVDKEIDNQINNKYPHLRNPSCMCAKVTNTLVDGNKRYVTLKILDKNMNIDNEFPEIPFVRTEIEFSKNDKAVIILLYGECSNPYVVGRYYE